MKIYSSIALTLSVITLITAHASGEDITTAELVEVWQRTSIPAIHCRLDVHISSRPSGGSAFGGNGKVRFEPEPIQDLDGAFWRNRDIGMLLRLGRFTSNLVDDQGLSISDEPPGGNAMQGMKTVVIQPEGETTLQKDRAAIELLHWVQPLATKIYSQIAEHEQSQFPIADDPQLGAVVQVRLRSRQEIDITLAKKFDWRVINLSVKLRDQPRLQANYSYSRDAEGRLILSSVQTTLFAGDSVSKRIETRISDIGFECDRSDLEIAIPNHALVTDYTKSPPEKRIIREDGSSRPFGENERRRAQSWDDLRDSEEGKLRGPQPASSSRLYRSLLVAGAVGLVAYLILRTRR